MPIHRTYWHHIHRSLRVAEFESQDVDDRGRNRQAWRVGLLLAAYVAGPVTMPMIYGAALVLGAAEVVAMTSGASIVPSAVPRERWQAVSVRITATEYLCNGFLGAPLGGFLVAAGMAVALGTTGIVYAAGIVLLLFLVGTFAPSPARERRPVHAEIGEGLRFLWNHRLLRTMAFLITVMAACWSAWIALIPTFATGLLGLDARGFGLLLTALGAGGVVGALITTPVNKLLGRRWAMFVDVVGSFLLVAVPAIVGEAIPVGVAAFVAGVGGTMWTVNSRVIVQSLVPNEMLGRFSSASRLVSWGMTPVAALIAGTLAQAAGFRVAFGFFAVACAALLVPFLSVLTKDALAQAG
jgi:MFS family permease